MNTDYEILLSDVERELGRRSAAVVERLLSRHKGQRLRIPSDVHQGRKIALADELIESGMRKSKAVQVLKNRFGIDAYAAWRIVWKVTK